MENSRIEWTHHTFNSWWGCVKVSPACTNCYAEAWAKRTGNEVWGRTARRRFFGKKHWDQPFKWDRDAERAGERRRVFCASMADVFEVLSDDHPDRQQMEQERGNLFALVGSTPHLDWLILTKRPAGMAEYFADRPVPDNVVAMTTAESQEWADRRIPDLLRVPARRRGVSLEPLLGEIDARPWLISKRIRDGYDEVLRRFPCDRERIPAHLQLRTGIDWVIVGGESGHSARAMHPDWARSLRDQCVAAGVPFHFKQWGEWMPVLEKSAADFSVRNPRDFHLWDDAEGNISIRIGKKAAGRRLDNREWNEFPEVARAV